MISTKGKRKIDYHGTPFYWFVRSNGEGVLRIHILSEDKKVKLEYPLFDSEIPVTPAYITHLLNDYYNK